jgi:Flp pilus assembly protein TadD
MPSAAEILAQAVRHQQAGLWVEAVTGYREAVRLAPDLAAAHTGLAAILFAQKRYGEAEECCRQALHREPESAASLSNWAAVLIKQGRLGEAESAARRALYHDPGNAGACNNLGNALLEQGRPEEAEDCLRPALRNAPKNHELLLSLGNALRAQGRLEDARCVYEAVLRDHPQHPAARLNRALGLLLSGEWEAGWRDYEFRWRTGESPGRGFRQPLWDGAPLAGRRILLHAEQGLGDTLQFVRYAKLVKERAGDVLVECQPQLTHVVETAAGVDRVIARGSVLPDFEVQAPLLSLPGILGTTPRNVPGCVPYLSADPERVSEWGKRLSAFPGLKAGVVWSGNPNHANDRRRSLAPELLSPLAKIPGVTLFALQPGSAPGGFAGLENDFRTVDDSAALMSQLDLVISVDTLAAHLAGALARPVWLLLPYVPDFRWLLGRDDTPWYPSMRLFRQSTRGDWTGVIALVAAALRDYAHHH